VQTEPETFCDTLAGALAARGVRHAFGMPGGVLLGLIDAFRRHGIDFVLVRHEGSAGFMAGVCAQLTGSPGVCLATLGPGVTNLLSPMAGAWLERSRVLAITGQIQTDLLGRYTHQILDQVALFEPISKHSVLLTPTDIEDEFATALANLDGGRPGPVHLDVPAELWSAKGIKAPGPAIVEQAPVAPGLTDEAALALRSAKRPVIAVGLADLSMAAHQAVTHFAHALRAPVITTYRAKGILDESDPWSAGAFGLSPVVDATQQALLEEADLLIAVGLDPVELRPQWLPGWPETLPMMVVDPHGQPDLCHPVRWDLRGDIPTTLQGLAGRVEGGDSTWTPTDIAIHRGHTASAFDDGPDGPAATIRAVQRGLGPDGFVSMDVGAHRITASHVWQCTEPLQQMQSNGFSSMGTGLPGAIAAKLCRPDQPVAALTGDMGLWMTLGELGVAQDRGLDLIVVFLADESLSLIELKQERIPLPNHGVRFSNPDSIRIAEAFGGQGRRVRGEAAVEAAVAEARAAGGLWIIEAGIDAAAYRAQM